jgi:hypothetical protein
VYRTDLGPEQPACQRSRTLQGGIGAARGTVAVRGAQRWCMWQLLYWSHAGEDGAGGARDHGSAPFVIGAIE